MLLQSVSLLSGFVALSERDVRQQRRQMLHELYCFMSILLLPDIRKHVSEILVKQQFCSIK